MTIESIIEIVKKIIDISLVWLAFYYILKNIRNNVKLTLLFKGVLIVIILKVISDLIGLTTIGLLLEYVIMWGPLALIIIFQPEIRNVLEQIGKTHLLGRHKILTVDERERLVYEIVNAVEYLRKARIGALIVLSSKVLVLGLVIAVAGGTLIEHLGMEDQIAGFITRRAVGILPRRLTVSERAALAKGQTAETFKKVFPYILAGVGIGAAIHNWLPQRWVEQVLGSGNPLGVVMAVLAGAPMYADIFGTIPIAEALLAKGALLGVVLSFMMAVTTLSLPSLIMLRKAVKPKLLGIFIAICAAGIVIVGYMFNVIQRWII